MNYVSTRDRAVKVGGAQAIARGISREAGLFVPESLPQISMERLNDLIHKDYVGRAEDILKDFLPEFSELELLESVSSAYDSKSFSHPKIAPVVKLDDTAYMLELWHGPTCAFKDMALQLLPHLLVRSIQKTARDSQVAILVATSGDTGKAALEGFKDIPGAKIQVFYPAGGVSKIQYLQMASQKGRNVSVCGVHGNFDDTQTAVKKIFTDPDMNEALAAKNIMFSSANSINWGRLVPQIVYYVSAYCDMVSQGEIAMGDTINVCVPTGNFGNILAAYYAKCMGLPLGRLICASNINNVLTDFINTGVYDRRREFVLTTSPSMDILISSNLERLIFSLYKGDDKAVVSMMEQLTQDGSYSIGENELNVLQSEFYGGFCPEEQTAKTIRETFLQHEYLCDTHTAVGLSVYRGYMEKTGDMTKTVIASTANPYKFTGSILSALTQKISELDEFQQAVELNHITGLSIPKQVLELSEMPERFTSNCEIGEMRQKVSEFLGV